VEGNVIFSNYSASGYNICTVKLKDALEYTEDNIKDASLLINRFDTIKSKDTDLSTTNYKSKPYRKLGHLFGFHSWMPFYADIEKIQADPASLRPGVTLMSQNQLSTVISSIGYEYASDKTNQIHTKVTLKGWYPVIENQLDYGGNVRISKLGSNVTDPVTIQPGLIFKNTILIPLNFSFGRFSQYIRPSLSTEFANNYIYIKERATYDYGQTFISGRIYFNNYHLSAIRDIYPKWAQILDLNYTFAPFDGDIYGSIKTFKTAFFFPGLMHNHSFRLRYETEIQNPQKLLYYNRASLPRSYKNIIPEQINFLSADYVMPLFYPDLNIPGVIFIQRFRASIFYDYALGTKNHYLSPKQFNDYTETFQSFGAELWTDFFVFRIPFKISGGVRTTWRAVNDLPVFELLFNVDVFGMKIGRNPL
jgi:hypothetical protein